MSIQEDLTGQTFGRLTVTGPAGRDSGRGYTWRCLCTCGGLTAVRGAHLKRGKVRSCGCLKREVFMMNRGGMSA